MEPQFLIVDLFCGAGGTTTGFAMAESEGNTIAKVIACVNHDPKAIKSHWLNHPEVKHYEEDIRTLDLTELTELVYQNRLLYPNAKLILWASLECTNFSKAKGGQPRDADSRTLADHLDRYITAIDPDYVQIENVVEFMSWGPLDENGKPVSKRSGSDWLRWRKHICSFGYRDEWREMNSADYGAYTSRNRLFGCFAKHGLPIAWPEATHSKKPSNNTLFTNVQKWKPVKDVLDFADEGESIFTRKKDLSPKTLERIYAGLIKYVAGGKEAFVLKYNSTDQKGVSRQASIDEPCPTIAAQNRLGMCFIAKYYSGKPEGKVIPVTGPAGTIRCSDGQSLVQPQFIVASNGGNPSSKVSSVENPARVITTSDNKALVQPQFIVQRNSGDPESKVVSVEGPARTLTSTAGNQDLVQASFIAKYYGNGDNVSSIEEPAGTLTTKDRLTKVQPVWLDKTYTGKNNHQSIEQPAGVVMANDKHQLVQTQWIDRNFTGGGQHSSIEDPAGTIMAVPKLNLVQAEPFILNGNFGHSAAVNEPSPVLTASRRHHYIVNPSHGGHSTSIDAPCPVIIARQDKAPLYLLQVEHANVAIPVYDTDPQIMIDIKIFMCLYGISDIKMRMLKVPELLRIQGFPEGYHLAGNQSDQKKFIGNSVVPHVVKAWCEAMCGRLIDERRAA